MAKVTEEIELKLNDESLDESLQEIATSAGVVDNVFNKLLKTLDEFREFGDDDSLSEAFKGWYDELDKADDKLLDLLKKFEGKKIFSPDDITDVNSLIKAFNALRNEANKFSVAFKDDDIAKDYMSDLTSAMEDRKKKVQSIMDTFSRTSAIPEFASVTDVKKMVDEAKLTQDDLDAYVESKKAFLDDIIDLTSKSLDSIDIGDVGSEGFDSSLESVKNQILNIRNELSDFRESKAFDSSSLSAYNKALNDLTHKYIELRKTSTDFKNAEKNATSETQAGVSELNKSFDEFYSKLNSIRGTATQNERLATIDNIMTQLDDVENKLSQTESNLNEAFKLNDLSGIQRAREELEELKNKAIELNNEMANARNIGISTEDWEERLGGYSSRISEAMSSIDTTAREASIKAKEHLVNNIKSGLNQIVGLVKKGLSASLNFGTKAVSKYFGVLKNGFTNLFNYVRKQFSSIGNIGTKLFGNFSSIFNELKGAIGLVGFSYLTKNMMDLANEAINVEKTLNNVFDSSASDIRDWASEFALRFDLTVKQARSFVTKFATSLSNLNISDNMQQEMAKNLTALSGDLAAFYSLDANKTSDMLQKALYGRAEALKSLGIVLNEATLNEYALSKGITQSYRDMSLANKTILRYNYILEQTSEVQGNAARNSASWSNQIRMLKAGFASLGSLIGGAFIKLLYPVVTVLNQIVASAVNAMNALAKLLGFDPVSLSELTGIGGGESSAPAIEDTTDALEDEADAMDGVGKASKNAAENLQGFDKLNNMTSQSASGASGKGVGAGLGGLIDFDSYYGNVPDWDDSPIKAWFDELWELLGNKDWEGAGKHLASGINSLVDMLYGLLTDKKLYDGIDAFSDAFTDFVKGLLDIDFENIGRLIGAGLNLITYAINRLYEDATKKDLLKKIGGKIADFFLGLSDEVDWVGAGKALTTGFRSLMDVLRGFFDTAEANDLSGKLSQNIKDFISGAIERLFGNGGAEEIGQNIASLLNFAFDLLSGLFDPENADKIGDAIVTVINTAINNIDEKKLEKTLSSILNFIGNVFGKIGDIDANELSDKIADAINGVADNGSLENAASGLATAFLKIVELIGDVITKVDWGNVGDAILSGIADSMKNNPEGKKYFQNALAIIFTAQLVGGALQLGLNALGKAIIEALATKIAGSKLLGGAIGQAVTNGTAEATASASTAGGSVGTAFATGFKAVAVVAVAAMAAELVDGFRSTINQKMAEINYNEESAVPQLTVNVDTTSLDNYIEKLARLQSAYYSLDGDIDSARGYLETLRKEGYENTEQFKALDAAINTYDNSGIFGRQKALDAVYVACGNVQAGINQTTLALSQLDQQSFDNLSNNFGQLTVGATYTLEELQRIADEAGEAGKNTGENYADNLTTSLSDIDVESVVIPRLEEDFGVATTLAAKSGNDVADKYDENLTNTINNNSSVREAFTNQQTVAGTSATTVAGIQGVAAANAYLNNNSGTVNADISVQNATRQNMTVAGQGANTVAITQGQTTARSYTSNVATTVSADTSIATNLTNKVSSATSQASATAGSKGREIGGNIVDGVEAGVSDDTKHSKIADAVGGLCSKIIGWFKDKLDIHSPSKVFTDLAGFIPSGVALGIEDNEDVALDAVKSFSDDIVSKFNLETVDVSEMIDVQGIDDVMSVARDKISSSLTGLTSTVGVQSDMVVQPKFKQTELDALTAQDASNSVLEQKLTNMASRLGMNQGSKMMNVSVYLDASNKLADFVINTQNGQVVKGGAF